MTITDEAKVKKIAETYGFEKQREMLIEECSELIQAVQKLKRAEDTQSADNIEVATMQYIEELADVAVMIEQMKQLLTPKLNQDLANKVSQKLDRQIQRIGKAKEAEKEAYDKWRSGVQA